MSDPTTITERPETATRAAPARQRWRLVLARAAGDPASSPRDGVDTWTRALESAGVPVAWSEGTTARPRISFAAPLPTGMAAEGELIDVVTTERWPAWRLRSSLADGLPDGWRLVDVHDVWLAGPPLAGQVAEADYRITLANAPQVPDEAAFRRAAGELLAAPAIKTQRAKGTAIVAYDLRPLLIDVRLAEPGPPTVLVARTRFHPELGNGRPEAVVAALGARLEVALEPVAIVRERLVLVEDLG